MRYFIDVNQEQMAVLAEDGRELRVGTADADARGQIKTFSDPKTYGAATVWIFDAAAAGPLVDTLWESQDLDDLTSWALSLGSPTLPAKPAGLSAQWVQDTWAFLCRYAGESTDPEPLPPAGGVEAKLVAAAVPQRRNT